jgi:DNA-directed RNA polymerase subunit RPC12/RpoP
MDPFHFVCPHCSARLRVRDSLSVRRQFGCPECGKRLSLAEGKDTKGNVRLQVAIVAENATASSPAPPPDDAKRRSAGLLDRLAVPPLPFWQRPLFVAWGMTGCCAAALLAYAFLIADNRSLTDPPEFGNLHDPRVAEADVPNIAEDGEVEDAASSESVDEVSQSQRRLEQLGTILLDYSESEGAFPPGTSPAPKLAIERRLSWQALLVDRLDDGHPPVEWNHPWDDRLNEPFVRRRLHEFQNPAIAALTGDDGYPATHFVGVAGVGEDAARLPASDRRAGIFGNDRRTRPADIRDGASNTWLVLGVREHLGSWAAGGRSTVRPLTREPYVNGPDGFGTGGADSMLALLADGSIRVVSAAADPHVLRSMAAMADGPLADPTEAEGESDEDSPSVASAVGTLIPLAADSESEEDQPLEPEFAPEPSRKKIDLAQSLRQPVLLYDQPRTRPLHEWLPGIADMVGAPIRFDDAELGAPIAGMKTPIRLRLENTTVGEILDSLLKPAGLAYRVETDHIRLVPRK